MTVGEVKASGAASILEARSLRGSEQSRRACARGAWWDGLPLYLAVFVGYLGLSFAIFHAAWAAPTTRLIGACCDSAAFVDTFEITGQSILHGANPLFSHVMAAPAGFNVMWQPADMPLVGVVMLPFEYLIGPVATYDLVVTLAPALVGLACFAALRRWVGGTIGPIAGSLFYGFSPKIIVDSLGHPQQSFSPLVSLIFLALVEILVYQRTRFWLAGGVLGLVVVGQLLSGEEVLAFVLCSAVILTVVLAALNPHAVRAHLPYAAKALGVALGVAALLAAAPAAEQLLGAQQIHGAVRDTTPFATNVAGYIYPNFLATEFTPRSVFLTTYAWFTASPAKMDFAQVSNYLGIPLLAWLFVVVVVKRRSMLVRVVTAATIVAAILGLGTALHLGGHVYGIWLPWRALRRFWAFQSVLPTSMSLDVDLGVAVLIAVGAAWAWDRRSRPARFFGAAVVFGVLIPLIPTFHFGIYQPEVPPFFTTSLVDQIPPGATVLLWPFPRGSNFDNTPPEIWLADAHLRFDIVGGGVSLPGANGQVGEVGGNNDVLSDLMDTLNENLPTPAQTPSTLAYERGDLVARDVQDVIVGPGDHEREMVSDFTRILRMAPRYVGGVYLWTNVHASG